MNTEMALLCRSWLFAPADNARRRQKAFECGADVVILDLEDAVAPDAKSVARAAAGELAGAQPGAACFVRVNGIDTPWCYQDLLAVVRPGLAGVVIPKAERAADLCTIDWVLRQLERERDMPPGGVALLGLVETAVGVESVAALAVATPRLARLSFGIADYSLDLGLVPSSSEEELAHVRARLVHASRVAGLAAPIDSVVVEYRDDARFRESAERGRRMGLAGKLCIHPDQVALANEVFGPSETEIAHARAVVAAFEAAAPGDNAAISVAGSFVDAPVVERARRLLAAAGHSGKA